ncbi:Non-reducing polyketide synthase PKS12 [Cladobotryum mycophilum]|uniref:Non-reducing polyketide synthase PKS12 n=1 Tax=Cladobotryum mycophilum TaxID=491253 RepID=A0ABR0SNA3_9HYPO
MQIRNILVLGDHQDHWFDLFKSLLKKTKGPLLSEYLTQSAQTIRKEINQDAYIGKDVSWRFSTMYELVDCVTRLPTECPSSIRCAIISLTQIGFILGYEEDAKSGLSSRQSLMVTGSGVGLITAAIFASSPSTKALTDLGQVAIALAFRIGSIAQQKIENVIGHHSGAEAPGWGYLTLASDTNETEAILRDFNDTYSLSQHRKCYIAIFDESETVVCGPRSSLELLRKQQGTSGYVSPCLIPLGARHLYSDLDIENLRPLLKGLATYEGASSPALLMSHTGEYLQATSYTDLVQKSIKSLLIGQQDNVTLLQTVNGILSEDECSIFMLADDATSHSFATHVQSLDDGRRVTKFNLQSTKGKTSQQPSKPAIAIVGMAGRFPGAADADLFWELLQAGRDVHRTVPADRFDYTTHSDPTGKTKNTSKSPYGCFIDAPGLFDPRFFNMSPKEAAQTDPAQRLMILTAYEALEMAGFVPNRTPSSRSDRVATFYGQASDDWRETNSSQDIDTYFIPGGIRAFGPGRINYHLKFSGPSVVVDTACSSSFAAIHMACNALWTKDCDTAIAGGANVLTNPDIFAGLSKGHFLSSGGPCKTFDATADGYCRADGVGSVILKRLEDAEIDNDNILGVILGVGTNHSADAVSITHPHAPTQATLYQSILSNNGVDGHDVDYVEMHGTGTAAGDYNEMQSVSEVFAPRSRSRRSYPLYVSSLKSNIGHGEAAAGISSLIKVLLMLRHNAIPPHVGIKGTINPAFPQDLEARNVHIPLSQTIWNSRYTATPRVAFLNNFSAAGGNTALLLREHLPQSAKRQAHPRSTHIISVSARTIRSLQMNMQRLADFIRDNPDAQLSDLSYTLTARRVTHPYRKTFTTSRLSEALSALSSGAQQSFSPVPSKQPNVVFTFTGQGSLYASLAKSLFNTSARFRRDILELDNTATAQGFPSIVGLVDGTVAETASLSPVVTQVGQVCVQLALARLWISWGIQPSAVIGHSLGEYPALAVAGVLSASDMIYLVGNRAQLLEEKCTPGSHGMLAVSADATSLHRHTVGGKVEVSCMNAPGMTVLGGDIEHLQTCAKALQAEGIRCTELPVKYAFHTAQVDSILPDFRRIANRVEYGSARMPVLSPLLGDRVEVGSNVFNAEYLCRHARQTVNFVGALSSVRNQRDWTTDAIWLEVGPHPTCTKFVQMALGSDVSVLASLSRGRDAWQTMAETVCILHDKGFAIEWDQYHQGFEEYHSLVDLPAYAWDLKNYWIDYKNDWALTKGDVVPVQESPMEVVKPRLQTTTVQRIVEAKAEPGKASVVTETDFADAHLAHIAAGHRVNDASLCPSSLYADMALTVGKYLYEEMYPGQPAPALNVCNMSVDKPFILDQKNDALFRISATATKKGAQLHLYTISRKDPSQRTEHASCEVTFEEEGKWSTKWNRKSYLIKDRISALEAAASSGNAHRIQRGLVYKLFRGFVDYDEDYQGIEEMLLDSKQLEASARVTLKPNETGTVYEIPPTWIDSFCHLTGAILNASDAMDTTKFVFISHGWGSLRLRGNLRTGISYRTYTRMQGTSDNIMEGDVWMFDGDEVVGCAKGIKFQRIPRKVIDILLPKAGVEPPSHASHPMTTQRHTTNQPKPQTKLQGGSSRPAAPPSSPELRPESSIIDQILGVISAECGVDAAEMVDGCTFLSLGIDSLLSLEILAKLRESLGIDLRPHVFLENESIGDLKADLLRSSIGNENEQETTLDPSANLLEPAAFSDESLYENDSVGGFEDAGSSVSFATSVSSRSPTPDHDIPEPKAVSYLLSGNPKKATKYLFLFPDGSGSATSYATLPSAGPDTAVFALNCPFMTTPSQWNKGFSSVIKLYLDEIYRRQPNGPYNFGGWSAGGILAYEAAAGNSAGTPEWVIPHFDATVRNLDTYTPLPLPRGKEPVTTAIWARQGVTSVTGGRRPVKEPGDPRVMEWLLEDRSDFTSNGWDSLIGTRAIQCEVMDGHHFSMTREHANELGGLIAKAMRR